MCSLEHVRSAGLKNALRALSDAITDVEWALSEMREQHDPLALHIYVSRRGYSNVNDTKSGKRSAIFARSSWQRACELGFRGTLEEWQRLLGAFPKR